MYHGSELNLEVFGARREEHQRAPYAKRDFDSRYIPGIVFVFLESYFIFHGFEIKSYFEITVFIFRGLRALNLIRERHMPSVILIPVIF